jgi:hypothetical protein
MMAIAQSIWNLARRLWEAASCTRAGIARRCGIPYADLITRARENKWSDERRNSSTDRMIIADRLLGLIELHIEAMEKRDMTESGEKEAAVLGKLTDTLGKLIAFAKAEARDPATELETTDMRDIRQQLAKRIDALTKG